MLTIAFICTANMCRSVMAHAICVHELALRGETAAVFSAGTMDLTGAPPAELAFLTCSRLGTPTQKTAATWVRDLPLATIEHFLVMQQPHVKALVKQFKVPPERVSLLGSFDPEPGRAEIEDPMGLGPGDFEHCYHRLRRCVRSYLDQTLAPR